MSGCTPTNSSPFAKARGRKSQGLRAKTDRIDARLILAFVCHRLAQRGLHLAIPGNPHTAKLAALLQTIFGIGPAVAAALIADLPELGLLSAKQIAALVGLAPHTNRSGKTQHREPTGHGRPGVRRALFNAARAAIRHPFPFRDCYDRLITQDGRGKPGHGGFWHTNSSRND